MLCSFSHYYNVDLVLMRAHFDIFICKKSIVLCGLTNYSNLHLNPLISNQSQENKKHWKIYKWNNLTMILISYRIYKTFGMKTLVEIYLQKIKSYWLVDGCIKFIPILFRKTLLESSQPSLLYFWVTNAQFGWKIFAVL